MCFNNTSAFNQELLSIYIFGQTSWILNSLEFSQIFSEESIAEILDDPEIVTDEKLDRFHGYFDRITGISSQALEDFKSLRKQHWALLYPVVNFVSCIFEITFDFWEHFNKIDAFVSVQHYLHGGRRLKIYWVIWMDVMLWSKQKIGKNIYKHMAIGRVILMKCFEEQKKYHQTN